MAWEIALLSSVFRKIMQRAKTHNMRKERRFEYEDVG